MQFHLPKPLHGWRAFAGEVGIIVIGVLIALGAQQLIENRNDRGRANDAMAALGREIVDHDFYASEIEIARPCIDAQIDVIQKRLVAGDQTPLPQYSDKIFNYGFVIRAPVRNWTGTAWDSVKDTDVLRQIEPEFAAWMANYYGQLGEQRSTNGVARGDLNSINALAVMMPHGDSDRLRFIEILSRLRSTIGSLDLVAGQLRDKMAKTRTLMPDDLRQRDLGDSGTIKFCKAHNLPLATLRPADARQAD